MSRPSTASGATAVAEFLSLLATPVAAVVGIPLLMALLLALLPSRRWTPWVNALASAASLGAAL